VRSTSRTYLRTVHLNVWHNMLPNYKRRQLPRLLIGWGAFVFVIFCIFLGTGRFEVRSGAKVGGGRRTTVISRQDSPLIYWGTQSSILFVAVSLVAAGAYRARKESVSDNA
jgi:hypothetical protein